MNETTAALALLLGVLLVAAVASRRVAVLTSLVAFVGFDFFFLPPVWTFAISKRDDVVALVTLLAVALIGSHLSQQARLRAEQALALERQRNEAELARRNAEARSALVASISHDLKSPLTALTVAVGNLAIAELSKEDQAEQLQMAREELRRLAHLFDNVMDMASVELNAMRPEREWVLCSEIIDAARHQVAAALESRFVHVVDQTGMRLLQLDPRMTSAALAHVLENAAAHAPKDLVIAIDASLTAGRLVIRVRDQGPGIPGADLERIFERGYAGTALPDRPFTGGMGLAITRGLLAVQGGRISAANDPAGGAALTLDIPVAVRAEHEEVADAR